MTKLLKKLAIYWQKTNGHMKTLNVFFRYVTSFTTCITSFREWNYMTIKSGLDRGEIRFEPNLNIWPLEIIEIR